MEEDSSVVEQIFGANDFDETDMEISSSSSSTTSIEKDEQGSNPHLRHVFDFTMMINIPTESEWIIDTGATQCITNNREILHHAQSSDVTIITGDKEAKLKGSLVGHIRLMPNSSEMSEVVIRNILFVPNASKNCISASQLIKQMKGGGQLTINLK